MKKINLFNFLLMVTLCILLPVMQGSAQNRWYGVATYQVSIPLSDTKEFIDKTSWLGWGLEFRYQVERNVTVGFNTGWYTFNQRTSGTLEVENGAITGTQDRYLNSFLIMLSAHYYFGNRSEVRPYAGLGAGGFWDLMRYSIGIYSFDNDRFDWGFTPEVGIIIPLQREYGIIISAKYNYAFTGESVAGKDFNNSFLGINVGFAWMNY